MIGNPLIKLRWLLLQETLREPGRFRALAGDTQNLDALRARLEDARPVLEAAPGMHERAGPLMSALLYAANDYRLIIKMQVAELTLAYVTVQLLHFGQVERELTDSERRFGKGGLLSMMQDASTLLLTALGGRV